MKGVTAAAGDPRFVVAKLSSPLPAKRYYQNKVSYAM